jgi:hypothetical protein
MYSIARVGGMERETGMNWLEEDTRGGDGYQTSEKLHIARQLLSLILLLIVHTGTYFVPEEFVLWQKRVVHGVF